MDHDALDTLLDRWRHTPEPPPALRQEVWRRIARSEERGSGIRERLERLFSRPAFAATLVCACLATGFLLSELRPQGGKTATDRDYALRYRALIDPTQPEAGSTGGAQAGQLEWLKDELQLSESQFQRIKAIHEDTSPQLAALANQVARLRGELADFERERRTEGSIDFLAFARWADTQRSVDQQCSASTRGLVLATAGVMNEAQRERYLGLLGRLPGDRPAHH